MNEDLLTRIWGVPPAGGPLPYLPIAQADRGTPQILVLETLRMTGRPTVYLIITLAQALALKRQHMLETKGSLTLTLTIARCDATPRSDHSQTDAFTASIESGALSLSDDHD